MATAALRPRYLGEAKESEAFWQARDGSWLSAGEVRAMSRTERAEWQAAQGYICGAEISGGWITDAGYCERAPGHLAEGLKHKAEVGCWPDGFHTEYWGSGEREKTAART